MNHFRKSLVFALSSLLLGQNLLFAQETLNEPIPLPLLQQQARMDASLLKEIGIPVFATAASVGLLVAAQQIIRQQITIQKLSKELTAAQEAAKVAEETAANATTKADEKFANRLASFKRQRTYYESQLERYEKSLQEAQALLGKRNTAAQQYISGGIKISEREAQFIDKCADFVLEPSASEQAIYRKYIYNNSILSPTEGAKFNAALEDIARVVRSKQPITAETYQTIGRLILHDKNLPASQRLLRALGDALVKKGAPSAVLLSAFLIASVATVNAAEDQQKNLQKANRILNNVNLFLDATPQQLEEMQKDPILYDACVQGAQALDLLVTQSTPEELILLKQSFPKLRLREALQPTLAR